MVEGRSVTQYTHLLRRFQRFEGIRVVITEGDGSATQPFREVTYWFDEEAREIARVDPAERGDA